MHQKFLCDAVATVNGQKLFVAIYRLDAGIQFESGRGEMKHGSPRRRWTAKLLKHEIAVVYGAQEVELLRPPGQPKISDSNGFKRQASTAACSR